MKNTLVSPDTVDEIGEKSYRLFNYTTRWLAEVSTVQF